MNVLEVEGITKKFKDFCLNDISFSLPAGYIMGYVGKNGAGKTTTLNIITGLLHATSGTVRIDGITIQEDPIRYKEMIGFIGDTSFFPDDFTGKEVIRTLRDFYPSFNEQKFRAYMKEWDLPENKKISQFSKGMQVRLMFADILSRDTKILILDEATNGLDPVIKDEILTLMQEYISDGKRSILFSTHILSDLEQIADYIFFIDEGEKVMCESKEEMVDSFLLLKTGPEDLTEELSSKIIGLKKTEVMAEGLIRADDAVYFTGNVTLEKPSVDQIVIHYILERGKERVLQ